MSRKLGKSLAEFRRASEDFKSTWEREVAIESPLNDPPASARSSTDDRTLFSGEANESIVPTIHPVSPEEHIPRETHTGAEPPATPHERKVDVSPAAPLQKRDWL